MTTEVHTDCRSEVGITVGIVDGVITLARLFKTRDTSSPEVQAALEDLRQDEDVAAMLKPPARIELRFYFCDPFGSHDIGDRQMQLFSDQDLAVWMAGFAAPRGLSWKMSPHEGRVTVYLAGPDSDHQWEYAGNILPVYASAESTKLLKELVPETVSS